MLDEIIFLIARESWSIIYVYSLVDGPTCTYAGNLVKSIWNGMLQDINHYSSLYVVLKKFNITICPRL